MRIAVVGGGPAGSRTADLLARQGARVVLYEARAGWEKPCGGGVPDVASDGCPFLEDPALPRRLACRARIYSCSDREAIVPLTRPLRIFSRRDLNAFLLEGAWTSGAEVRHARVRRVERDGRSWRIEDASGRMDAFDFLVGADGAAGTVRAAVLRRGAAPLDRALAVGCYLEGYTSTEIVLKFFPRLSGYLWIFPRTDHLAVGICGPAGHARGGVLLAGMNRFLVDLYGPGVMRRLRRYGACIPSLPTGSPARGSCQGEGWALVGDAAGFVDPLSREGIRYALASADLLAGALREGRPALYGERWERRFGAELDWAARHRDLFFSRSFIEAFTVLTSASAAIQGVVSDLIAGRQPYPLLRRRLLGHAPAAAGSLALRVLERLVAGPPLQPPPGLTSLPG
jgi:flavin-dependent dehydrogenase